jgi:predicted Zn-ribbon and HTH transcriptional regulator
VLAQYFARGTDEEQEILIAVLEAGTVAEAVERLFSGGSQAANGSESSAADGERSDRRGVVAVTRKLKIKIAQDKVDAAVIDAALKSLKLDTTGEVTDRIVRLATHFKQKTPKADIADCTNCGGESDINFAMGGTSQCPYCGDEGVEEDKPVEPKEPKEQKLVKVQRPEMRPESKGGNDVAALDSSIAEIERLKLSSATNIHALGTEIRRLYELELWKLRKVEGLIAYRNFKHFCAAELHMSHTYAYKLIDVAKAFTSKQIEELGASKLSFVLAVPPQHREKLLEDARKGASTKQLKAKADELAGKRKVDAVTVAVAVGRITLPLFARPSKETKDAPPKVAKKLEDDPWAVEDMTNDVRTLYWVKRNAKGEMVLVVERRRT